MQNSSKQNKTFNIAISRIFNTFSSLPLVNQARYTCQYQYKGISINMFVCFLLVHKFLCEICKILLLLFIVLTFRVRSPICLVKLFIRPFSQPLLTRTRVKLFIFNSLLKYYVHFKFHAITHFIALANFEVMFKPHYADKSVF